MSTGAESDATSLLHRSGVVWIPEPRPMRASQMLQAPSSRQLQPSAIAATLGIAAAALAIYDLFLLAAGL